MKQCTPSSSKKDGLFHNSLNNIEDELHLAPGGLAYSAPIVNLRNIFHLTLGFFSTLSLQRETVILMYHSIDSVDDFHAVHLEQFKQQIEYLRKKYTIISLNEMVEFVRQRNDLPRKTVTITFDDGFDDFYSNVYSHFRKMELPATVFVTTGYVGREWPFSRTHQKMLTWGEIEEMSKNNIEIGAHTVTHPDLREIDLLLARNEILQSKLDIESHINRDVNYFSYPFGRYNKAIIDTVKSLGFAAALGGGGTVQRNSQVFVLNRIQVDSSATFMLFKARITKAYDWLRKLEQIPRRTLGRPLPDSVIC